VGERNGYVELEMTAPDGTTTTSKEFQLNDQGIAEASDGSGALEPMHLIFTDQYGDYTITAHTYDAAGNKSTSTTKTIERVEPEPEPEIEDPEDLLSTSYTLGDYLGGLSELENKINASPDLTNEQKSSQIAKINQHRENVKGTATDAYMSTMPYQISNPQTWADIQASHKVELQVASAVISSIPIVGDAKDIIEVITGKDYITGEDLTLFDRGITVAAAFVPLIGGSAARLVVKQSGNTGVFKRVTRGFGATVNSADQVGASLKAVGVTSKSALPLGLELAKRGVQYSSKAELARALKNEKLVSSNYNTLNAMTSGVRQAENVEIHHLLETRMIVNNDSLYKVLPSEVNSKVPSIVLDKAQHQAVTTRLQQLIPYGSNYSILSKSEIISKYRTAYNEQGMGHMVDQYIVPMFH